MNDTERRLAEMREYHASQCTPDELARAEAPLAIITTDAGPQTVQWIVSDVLNRPAPQVTRLDGHLRTELVLSVLDADPVIAALRGRGHEVVVEQV